MINSTRNSLKSPEKNTKIKKNKSHNEWIYYVRPYISTQCTTSILLKVIIINDDGYGIIQGSHQNVSTVKIYYYSSFFQHEIKRRFFLSAYIHDTTSYFSHFIHFKINKFSFRCCFFFQHIRKYNHIQLNRKYRHIIQFLISRKNNKSVASFSAL